MLLTIYSDASTGRKGRNQLIGLGAVILREGQPWREVCRAVGSTRDMSSLGEVLAVEAALKRLTPDVRSRVAVRVVTDHKSLIQMVAQPQPGRKHHFAYARVRKLLDGCLSWTMEWVPGHSGNRFNDRADALARRAVRLEMQR